MDFFFAVMIVVIMKLEFVHIPKTAGSSIESTYSDFGWGRERSRKEIADILGEDFEHPCSFYHNPFIIEDIYPGVDRFCVMRDPIDRLVSHYKWVGFPDHTRLFNDILTVWFTEDVPENPFHHDNHLCPQIYFIEKCRYILPFHTVETSLNHLLRLYDIEPRPLLREEVSKPYKNVHRDLISAENMRIIMEYYAKDIELFQTFQKDNIIMLEHEESKN